MARRYAAAFLLSLLVVAFLATSVVVGAEKPQKPRNQRVTLPARYAPVYHFAGAEEGPVASSPMIKSKTALGSNVGKPAWGQRYSEVMGTTTYGYQSNCTMGWQIAHRGTHFIHMDWMYQSNNLLGEAAGGDRDIHYQVMDLNDCQVVFAPGGIQVADIYAGYCDMDAEPNGWGIPASHYGQDGDWFPSAWIDFVSLGSPPQGIFQDEYPTDRFGHYQNNGTGPDNETIWPIIAYQPDAPGDPVLHMVSCETGGEAGDPQTISYHRRVGPYDPNTGVWSGQRLIDTVMNINMTIACSRTSGKVAILWNAPADYVQADPEASWNQLENDVWLATAADYGTVWASLSPGPSIGSVDGVNITQYDPMNDYKAYCDMAMSMTTQDVVHITWGCRRWTDTTSLYRRQSAIFHWKEGDPVPSPGRTVVKALWDTGGACYAPTWGSDVAKMSISECDGKMYCLFTQFGKATNPCGDVDDENTVLNGYLYMSVYDPVYDAWDRAQRVTNLAETPNGCIGGTYEGGPGTCNAEYWATMARHGRLDTCWNDPPANVLDIQYIHDYAPGGCVQTNSGVWTTNDVTWTMYECREAVPEPIYGDDAGTGYGICNNSPILVVPPGSDTSWTMTIENSGLINMNITDITVTQNDPNVTITTVPDAPPTIVIGPGGGTQDVEIFVSVGGGATDPSTVEDEITITHDAEGNPRVIPICVTVSSTYVPLESATLSTTCKRLRVYNDGGMSNDGAHASMDFIDETDCAAIYLYDASPVVCYDDGGGMNCYFSVFGHNFADDNALRQLTPVFVDSLNNESYTYATAEFITADSAVGMIVEYFTPKHEDSCCFMIEKLKFWNRKATVLSAVAVGEILDWDIPSFESDMDNESGKDEGRQLIYQYACDRDPCDTLVTAERYGGIAASAEQAFKNYFTLQNATWVYTSGDFGDEAPFPPDTTYGLMTANDGFFNASLDSCEDLTTLVTFGVYDMLPEDTHCVVKILSTSRFDANAATLKENIDKGNAFIVEHPEIKCEPGPGECLCLPGDANGDGQINVGDAVYIIGYVFKGGDPPTPYDPCSGDANGDCQCNVGDAVYIISYVFKGGDPPVTCEFYRDEGGDGSGCPDMD
jgi:hypothetical protein